MIPFEDLTPDFCGGRIKLTSLHGDALSYEPTSTFNEKPDMTSSHADLVIRYELNPPPGESRPCPTKSSQP